MTRAVCSWCKAQGSGIDRCKSANAVAGPQQGCSVSVVRPLVGRGGVHTGVMQHVHIVQGKFLFTQLYCQAVSLVSRGQDLSCSIGIQFCAHHVGVVVVVLRCIMQCHSGSQGFIMQSQSHIVKHVCVGYPFSKAQRRLAQANVLWLSACGKHARSSCVACKCCMAPMQPTPLHHVCYSN
jgi:hypothetical protein